jgi:hypothetical protein
MNEIICPHCNRAFKIDEAGYADILKKVRNHEFEEEFEEELKKRETFLAKDKENAILLTEERIKNSLQQTVNEKEQLIQNLKAEKERDELALQTKKDSELPELKAKLQAFETEKALAVSEALNKIHREGDQLESELNSERTIKQFEIQSLESSYKKKLVEEYVE